VRIIRNLSFVLLVATVAFVYNPPLAARANDCPMNEIGRGSCETYCGDELYCEQIWLDSEYCPIENECEMGDWCSEAENECWDICFDRSLVPTSCTVCPYEPFPNGFCEFVCSCGPF
jgi:hypothetical protein